MTALLPRFLTTSTLPRAELDAARLDGEVIPLLDGWACVDEPPGAALRTDVIRHCIGPRTRVIAVGATAAWIHGAADVPPARIEICTRRRESTRPPRLDGAVATERTIADRDIQTIAGMRVTAPFLTAVDLLASTRDTRSAGDRATTIARLLILAGRRPDAIRRALRGTAHPGVLELVSEALGRLEAQPLLTRYTS